jgi:hypothetical protein
MRLACAVLGLVVAWARPARADGSMLNFSVGPVFAIKLNGAGEWPAVIGLEGGVGIGPERINLGFEHRADHDAGYAEFDPWFVIGGTVGVAVDDDGTRHVVAGAWEGIPVAGFEGSCNEWQDMVTLAGGYRYTGVHELYLTIKAGRIDGSICNH